MEKEAKERDVIRQRLERNKAASHGS